MIHWCFLVYFTVLQATGLLLTVLSSEQVFFLGSGLIFCATSTENSSSRNPNLQASRTGALQHDSRSHAHGERPDNHHTVSHSDIPFIHCEPIPAYVLGEYLSLPFELPGALLLPQTIQPEIDLLIDKPKLSSRNEGPSPPPPKHHLSHL